MRKMPLIVSALTDLYIFQNPDLDCMFRILQNPNHLMSSQCHYSIYLSLILIEYMLDSVLYALCSKSYRYAFCTTSRIGNTFSSACLLSMSNTKQVNGCGSYQYFLDRGLLLGKLLLNQGYLLAMLKLSLRKFYTRAMTWLTAMEYLCHKLPLICSSCRKHFPVLSSFMTDHWVCNQINTTGATRGAETAYPSGAFEFTSGFQWVCVTRSLVLCVCFLDRCLSFCTFSFGNCVLLRHADSDYPFYIFKLFFLHVFAKYVGHKINMISVRVTIWLRSGQCQYNDRLPTYCYSSFFY